VKRKSHSTQHVVSAVNQNVGGPSFESQWGSVVMALVNVAHVHVFIMS